MRTIGTRGSRLALEQTRLVQQALRDKNCPYNFEIKTITTSGDRITNKNLYDIGGKGLFLKEIEEQLLAKEIDIAIHSAKDIPAYINKELVIPAILPRGEVRDSFVSFKYKSLSELPLGAKVGTSSIRRKGQLKIMRPDLEILNCRGNVDTRLAKLQNEEYDAIILAGAGLTRLNIDRNIYSFLEDMLPAIGQGAIAVECRAEDKEMIEILSSINDNISYMQVETERCVGNVLESSCHTPIAVYAEIEGEGISINSWYSREDMSKYCYKRKVGELSDRLLLAQSLALEMRQEVDGER